MDIYDIAFHYADIITSSDDMNLAVKFILPEIKEFSKSYTGREISTDELRDIVDKIIFLVDFAEYKSDYHNKKDAIESLKVYKNKLC